VVVADENHVSRLQRALNLGGVKQRIVAAEGLVEVAKVFAPMVRILGADFAFNSRQRVQLCGAATGSKIGSAGHENQLLASSF
jgi:hypothetical protein